MMGEQITRRYETRGMKRMERQRRERGQNNKANHARGRFGNVYVSCIHTPRLILTVSERCASKPLSYGRYRLSPKLDDKHTHKTFLVTSGAMADHWQDIII